MRLALAAEFQEVIRSYGSFLRRDVAVGHDHNLKAALNRIRLQDQILDGVGMADVTEACALLGLSPANASQSMKRCEGQVMRFKILRRAKYPLFQFDVRCDGAGFLDLVHDDHRIADQGPQHGFDRPPGMGAAPAALRADHAE